MEKTAGYVAAAGEDRLGRPLRQQHPARLDDRREQEAASEVMQGYPECNVPKVSPPAC